MTKNNKEVNINPYKKSRYFYNIGEYLYTFSNLPNGKEGVCEMKGFTVRILIFSLIVVFSLFTFGCDDSEKVKREVVPKLIEKVVSDTQKAILEKDVQLAREIWSKVTEYSVKANELGDKELSEALGRLATTYVKLIEYCESGEENFLKVFNMEFAKALDKIKNVRTVVDRTQALEPVFSIV
ncbi:MAG: hypothetical protein PWQ67_2726 [Clostridia bacterium]|nr:hypothetical protein [Clostridia bacterium]MDN5324272.1 hypothetical protein [Clostridia bacterium]